jgi:carbamoyl-phosphate synthase large subunit
MPQCRISKGLKMSKHNILILSAGRRVELVQSFQKALKHHFPNSIVCATDLRPQLSAACQIADQAFVAPRVTAPEYIDFLLNLCDEHSIGMLIPTIDTELNLLAENRSQFEDRGIFIIISSAALVAACRDKRNTIAIYDQMDIDQPAIYSRENLKFPCFCKPYDGSCSVGAQAIPDANSLTIELIENEKNMFMELVGKEYGEYTVDAYYDRRGELRCLVPRERIEVRGGEVSKGITRKNYVYRYLRNRLEKMEGARGCITIQIFANPENELIKALEINPRFGGGYPLSFAAGANYPDWLIREYFLNDPVTFFDAWEDNLLMLRYDSQILVHEN